MAEHRYRLPPATDVFSVEDNAVQVVWRNLPPGRVELEARVLHESTTHRADYERVHPAGGLVLDGLTPATSYDLTLRVEDMVVYRDRVTTLVSPPGEEVYRLATLNDLHLGCSWFGPFGRMRESLTAGDAPASDRCAAAAVVALREWGAERVVLRGDLVHRGEPAEWAAAGELLGSIEVPIDLALGNHETDVLPWRTDLATGLAELDIELREPIRSVQLPAVDLLLADTAVAHTDPGVITHIADALVDAAAAADNPVLLMTHHNLERRRDALTLPRGVSHREAAPFLDRLAQVAPASLVSSGHTHRHRRRMHRTVPVVEIGSPKDYPGVWSGYVIHEGGVRQMVRRITEPTCIEWIERTRTSMAGIWGCWSTGRRSDRGFSHPWPPT